MPSTRIACSMSVFLMCVGAGLSARDFVVSPTGDDLADGSGVRPFRTLERARDAVRAALPTATGDISVLVRPGSYRLSVPLVFSAADSGREGVSVVWRASGGAGSVRISGSVPVTGWQRHSDRIWKVALPEGTVFHTAYEGGVRLRKARFPNYVHDASLPAAAGEYLVSASGSPKLAKGTTESWLTFRESALPPEGAVPGQMKINVFPWGKCDWHRWICRVTDLDRGSRRITFDNLGDTTQILGNARYFLEDDLHFLDTAGEFFLDEAESVLYCIPLGAGHPDTLGITIPVAGTLIRVEGADHTAPVRNLSFEGLSLEETDGLSPSLFWWKHGWGRTDHGLIVLRNTERIRIRDCHLRNSGRNGVLMVDHNVGNQVTGCWIEQMGVNGITLSNRFKAPDGKGPTPGRLEENLLCNNRIHDVGQLSIYASCINLMSGSRNEICHSELYNSPRYATTMRGNTNAQHEATAGWHPNMPPAKENVFHHLRVHHCGQDSGDMGALHTATVNIPGGDCINTFSQITIADTRALASMKDIPPNGIFLDWPFRSMHQVFRDIHVVRAEGIPFRTNGADNAKSTVTENVSWKAGFDRRRMEYGSIGLKPDFPAAYGGAPPPPAQVGSPVGLVVRARGCTETVLSWQPPAGAAFTSTPSYSVYRDGKLLATAGKTTFTDRGLTELQVVNYQVSAQDGDWGDAGPLSEPVSIRMPADTTAPRLLGAAVAAGLRHVLIRFSEPVSPASATNPALYRIEPHVAVAYAAPGAQADTVILTTGQLDAGTDYVLHAAGIVDRAAARNVLADGAVTPLKADFLLVHYRFEELGESTAADSASGIGQGRLQGGAACVYDSDRASGVLSLDGRAAYLESSADLDLGAGDFTLAAWIWKELPGNRVILAKGNGFGSPSQWSWGWEDPPQAANAAFRTSNSYYTTAEASIPIQEWLHVAFVRKGGKGTSYVNGVRSGDEHDLAPVGDLTNDKPLTVGRRAYEPSPAWFRGKIDDLRIYTRALTAEEIRALAVPPGK